MNYLWLRSHPGSLRQLVDEAIKLVQGMGQDFGVGFTMADGTSIDRLTLSSTERASRYTGVAFMFNSFIIRVSASSDPERLERDHSAWLKHATRPGTLGPCTPTGWLPVNREARDLMENAPPMWLSDSGLEFVVIPSLDDVAAVNDRMFAEPWARRMQWYLELDAENTVAAVAHRAARDIAPHLSATDLAAMMERAVIWLMEFWSEGPRLFSWHQAQHV